MKWQGWKKGSHGLSNICASLFWYSRQIYSKSLPYYCKLQLNRRPFSCLWSRDINNLMHLLSRHHQIADQSQDEVLKILSTRTLHPWSQQPVQSRQNHDLTRIALTRFHGLSAAFQLYSHVVTVNFWCFAGASSPSFLSCNIQHASLWFSGCA